MKKKICVVTGGRAEYGILKPLIDIFNEDADVQLQLIVTGMHLSSEFGNTYRLIEADGIHIDEKIEIILSSDTPVSVSKSMGLAMISFSEAYERLKPDCVVVLGDRFEILSVACAAHVARIPIAHIAGGQVTEGTIDDSFRHSISKMSLLHFVSTEVYRKRVIQLGEDPKRVFTVGAMGVDNVKGLPLLSKEDLEKKVNIKFGKKNLLVTFHSVTLENATAKGQFEALLEALDELENTKIIFTKTNADTFGRVINKMIDQYLLEHPDKGYVFTSMGQLNYLSAIQFIDAVVGNSSSALIEVPSFKKATINVGDRQKGRIKAASVIDCEPVKESIREAIDKSYSKEFQDSLKDVVNPYGEGIAAKSVNKIIGNWDFSKDKDEMLKKVFYDI